MAVWGEVGVHVVWRRCRVRGCFGEGCGKARSGIEAEVRWKARLGARFDRGCRARMANLFAEHSAE